MIRLDLVLGLVRSAYVGGRPPGRGQKWNLGPNIELLYAFLSGHSVAAPSPLDYNLPRQTSELPGL